MGVRCWQLTDFTPTPALPLKGEGGKAFFFRSAGALACMWSYLAALQARAPPLRKKRGFSPSPFKGEGLGGGKICQLPTLHPPILAFRVRISRFSGYILR